VFASYQDYCVLGFDSLFLGYQCFTEIRYLHNRGTNFSTRIKIHGVLCQKLVILIQSLQPQSHACFNTHFTSPCPHVSLWTSMKTGWNKWQVTASLLRQQRKQAFITAYFCTAWLSHKFLRFLSYSTFRYATEYSNFSVPAQNLQTWDMISKADILFVVIFHRILIQYNRRAQQTARGPHRPTWVRGAALATFTNTVIPRLTSDPPNEFFG